MLSFPTRAFFGLSNWYTKEFPRNAFGFAVIFVLEDLGKVPSRKSPLSQLKNKVG